VSRYILKEGKAIYCHTEEDDFEEKEKEEKVELFLLTDIFIIARYL